MQSACGRLFRSKNTHCCALLQRPPRAMREQRTSLRIAPRPRIVLQMPGHCRPRTRRTSACPGPRGHKHVRQQHRLCHDATQRTRDDQRARARHICAAVASTGRRCPLADQRTWIDTTKEQRASPVSVMTCGDSGTVEGAGRSQLIRGQNNRAQVRAGRCGRAALTDSGPAIQPELMMSRSNRTTTQV